jgi:hypothetical protein
VLRVLREDSFQLSALLEDIFSWRKLPCSK